MKRTAFKLIEAVRTSYWFIPSVMALLAIGLGLGTLWLDLTMGENWLGGLNWYRPIEADGAREVLSTIAGSMITVAGVVFSITIVAISYASGQYGPRVLTNFMSDRGNTITLGTFIATFLYCLVVLLTVRAGDDRAFVPQLSVMVGLLLAFASIMVLIYFIHHVPQSIHINTVIARIGEQLMEDVAERFPASIGKPAPAETADSGRTGGPDEPPDALLAPVISRTTGYIQLVDEAALLSAACRHDVIVRLRYRPGDFVVAGRALMDASPAHRLDQKAADALAESYTTGDKRTPAKDLGFLVSELAEIACRALSPGVNDPFTAVTCLDWLGAFMSELAGRRIPSPQRADESGAVRVISLTDDFASFVAQGFGRIRQYAANDMVAALHMLRTLGEVGAACRRLEQLRALADEGKALARMAEDTLTGPALETVLRRALELDELLAAGVGSIGTQQQRAWLGGSAG